MDPVSYNALPSAPPAEHVKPEFLTIQIMNPEPPAPQDLRDNRRWFCICTFSIFVFLFAVAAFYYMLFGAQRKN
jgi:hypothetical protein